MSDDDGVEREIWLLLPHRLDVGTFEVSGTVPSPAPDCERRRARRRPSASSR